MPKKKTKEEFIKKAKEIHGDKYDYSKVDYVNSATKVCIICPKSGHGEFLQRPSDHTRGIGCPKCGVENRSEKKTSTKEEFIKKARLVHGNKYDYSKVEYVHNATKVCIICPEHGEFWQRPSDHARGIGCSKCSGNYIPTTEEWIDSARKIHGDKYYYTKVNYVNNKTKVCIICPEHGEFKQMPYCHLQEQGCPKCNGDKIRERQTLTKEEFIKKAYEVHGDKYDYSKVDYVNSKTKVCIICREHGEFWQTPNAHIKGCGCPMCKGSKIRERFVSNKEAFIKKARLKHGDKYDYSKVEYVNSVTKVCIICREHGEFWQTPNSHLSGQGCLTCWIEKQTSTKEEFIKKANEVHKDKYDYSKVDYVNSTTKVCIICHEHGEFWQTPDVHTKGSGCQKCNLSHLERSVMTYLDEHEIAYDYQKRFDWLGRQSLDFYLPDYKIGIECQGLQHFEEVDYFGGKEGLNECKKRDKRKFKKCQKNGIKVLYYSNLGIEYPYDVFEDLDLLFKEIKN
nr:MAG TPA: restriction enzyme [Caudoviricetes sp.]